MKQAEKEKSEVQVTAKVTPHMLQYAKWITKNAIIAKTCTNKDHQEDYNGTFSLTNDSAVACSVTGLKL